MAGIAGIDTAHYPGKDIMQNLFDNTNLRWTGFYLTPAPSQGGALGWMDKSAGFSARDELLSIGWGLAPIYVGQQDPATAPHLSYKLTLEQGATDAQDAIALAESAGFPQGSVIYLDIEIGGPISAAFLSYTGAWIQGVFDGGYTAGVYCSAASHVRVTDQVRGLDSRTILWGININKYKCSAAGKNPFPDPNPGDCEAADASLWQLLQGCTISDGAGHTLVVDLDSSLAADPSSIVTPPSLTRPNVTGVNPDRGSPAGGDTVVIAGSGFTGASSIAFASTDAQATIDSDTQITAVSPPANQPGVIDIVISGPGGASDTVAEDQFTYDDSLTPAQPPAQPGQTLPVVTGISPNVGAPGDTVTITGTGFNGVTGVGFDMTGAELAEGGSDTEIQVTVPDGHGTLHVTVTTPAGTSETSDSDQFTYQ